MEKQHIHNLILLDESGSMYPIKDQIISGFNETLETIRHAAKTIPNQEHVISMFSFNGIRVNEMYFGQPVEAVKKIDDETYDPNASTPLLDALGHAMSKVKAVLPNENYKVVVTILTDGMENASREYSWDVIKKMIQDLKQAHWDFTYIGTDHDIEKVALNLSISNTMFFKKSKSGIANMFVQENAMRMNFYNAVDEEFSNKSSSEE